MQRKQNIYRYVHKHIENSVPFRGGAEKLDVLSQEDPLGAHFERFMKKVATRKQQMLDRILLTASDR